jgi:hypothetical protein
VLSSAEKRCPFAGVFDSCRAHRAARDYRAASGEPHRDARPLQCDRCPTCGPVLAPVLVRNLACADNAAQVVLRSHSARSRRFLRVRGPPGGLPQPRCRFRCGSPGRVVRQRATELRRGRSGAEEDCSAGSWSCLGKRPGGHNAEREPRVDECARQVRGRRSTPFDDGGDADFLGVADAFVDGVEGLSVIEVSCVNDTSGGAQLIREGEEAGGLSLIVVDEQDLGRPVERTRAATGKRRSWTNRRQSSSSSSSSPSSWRRSWSCGRGSRSRRSSRPRS